ncbi:GNAT family N-acetyltransferase [Thermobifida halotolerans]|uniref:GNAT family N-acetyltransferase n=1 Tax=Thermobifida halotolerans TaxID=483545 RepID=A0A399G856_9ACTN|nr:GNAT family N-acetyltransferase [Thermobifida halotolerans]UOE22051.1 GNAT family N-acetyltransferase [Thermobifida halotolerans]
MPSVILETDRMLLRAFTEGDVDDVLRAARDPLTQRWLPIPAPGQPYTRSDAVTWCVETAPAIRATGDGQQWAAVCRETGRYVGSFGLVRTNWAARVTEIGYLLAPDLRGRGLAPEAVVAVTRWALLDQGFERVALKAATANTASRRVAEKAGYVYEGIERNSMPLHRGRTDLAVYSAIRPDLAG